MSTVNHSVPGKGPKLRILVVDDQKDTAKMLQLFIQTAGHEVHTVGSKAEALEWVDREPIDLLVSDLRLPDGSGNELMTELRARGPIKGIVFSGLSNPEEKERSEAAGFSAFLVKPQDLDRLLDVVRDISQTP